jgi:hypothetical protein
VRRDQFEHLVAAAANIVGEDEFVVIGSQALLASHADADGELVVSMELDLYPRRAPEKAEQIDGVLGDGSRFHQTYGYYAHGVGPETALAPAGWQQRLVIVDVPARLTSDRQPVALCLEPHDLVLAKCAAGRSRDWVYAEAALAAGFVSAPTLLTRVDDLPLDAADRERVRGALAGIVARLP